MPAEKTTIDDFCFSLRLKFEEWRIESQRFAHDLQTNPRAGEKVAALAHVVAQATTMANNLSTVIAAQSDPEVKDWLYWAESRVLSDLAEIRRMYRIAQFHADPTESTMAAAMGWYSTSKVAEARARLTS